MKIIIELEREDDDRWIADIPEVPGAMAYGESQLEAIAKALAIRHQVVLGFLVTGEWKD